MSAFPRAGDMRHRVTLQTNTTSTNSFGDTVASWSGSTAYWAFVRPLSARESVTASELKAEVSHVVTMRHLGSVAVTPKMRLLFGSRVLNIVSVLNIDEHKSMYSLMCMEVVS